MKYWRNWTGYNQIFPSEKSRLILSEQEHNKHTHSLSRFALGTRPNFGSSLVSVYSFGISSLKTTLGTDREPTISDLFFQFFRRSIEIMFVQLEFRRTDFMPFLLVMMDLFIFGKTHISITWDLSKICFFKKKFHGALSRGFEGFFLGTF